MEDSRTGISPDLKVSSERVYIIAEAGVNHNGRLDLAKRLVKAAANAGADAIKFQTFKAEKIVSRDAPKAVYQKLTTDENESQFKMLKKLELNLSTHKKLLDYCRNCKIQFLSSPFDHESIDMLQKLELTTFKIPSGEITNLPYLRKIGALNKNVILSSGMADLEEIGEAIDILVSSGTKLKKILVLHCNTEYPTPVKDVNLLAMKTIADRFNVNIGYSDHTIGIEIPIAAVSLGAKIIEKHFTLDKNLPGPDHKSSLEPVELKAMVKAIRNIEKALGNGLKIPSLSEARNKEYVRKSLVAAVAISRGEILTDKNITAKRPGSGISPMKWDEIIGTPAKRDYKPDELI